MPRLTDLAVVRDLLNRDPTWAAYAIGDLSAELVEHCEWRASGGAAPALLLIYRGFDPPIAFAMGDPDRVRELLAEVDAPDISLHLPPEMLDAISTLYELRYVRHMWRMVLQPAEFRPAAYDDVTPLDEDDVDAVSALYADGHRIGEGPTFFHPNMLRQRTFRGVWEQDALVSIAGTHLFSADLGVCTIGNVYTRSDRRGRGLAARVTSAVVAHAIREDVPTIVLNVAHDNVTARRVYERLGFDTYCHFVEGEARRVK
jgi:GNAT superfamily N-acetyltransferase